MNNSIQENNTLHPVWRDFTGIAHACRAVDVHDAFLLMFTLCDRSVPPNARYAQRPDAEVTCPACASRHS